MNIYIMRHGEAGFQAHCDAERALTTHGKKQTRYIATELKSQLAHIDYGLVSPYLRAQQTLKIVQDVIPIEFVETTPELTSDGSVDVIADYLNTLHDKKINSVLLISHLPLVGYLISNLCPSVPPPLFSTAAIALVTLSPEGVGTYQWMQTPK